MSASRAADILAQEILLAYPQGLFPMADHKGCVDYSWYRPHRRGIMDFDQIHISRSLARFARQNEIALEFAYNLNFERVIKACAMRDESWINPTIRDAFLLLHQRGVAHSAEIYFDKELIGGVYGLSLGSAFFGESMFSHAPNGSKLALCGMLIDLKHRNFTLYDTQFLTTHLQTLGGIEISAKEYAKRLEQAIHQAPIVIPKGAQPNIIQSLKKPLRPQMPADLVGSSVHRSKQS